MKVQWESSVYVGQSPVVCAICGDKAYPVRAKGGRFLLAVIYTDQGTVIGEACRSCVAAGSHQIKERLQERIEGLQAKILDLQALAAAEIQLPTLEEEFNSYSQGAF